MTGTDRLIRWSTIGGVSVVALVAAFVSYRHALTVVRAHGESGALALAYPLTIDGMIYASSMVLLNAARRGAERPWLAYAALGIGIAATLAAKRGRGDCVRSGRRARRGLARARPGDQLRAAHGRHTQLRQHRTSGAGPAASDADPAGRLGGCRTAGAGRVGGSRKPDQPAADDDAVRAVPRDRAQGASGSERRLERARHAYTDCGEKMIMIRALRWFAWLTALLLALGVLGIVPLAVAAMANELAPAWMWLAWAVCLLAVVLLPRRWARSIAAPPWKTEDR